MHYLVCILCAAAAMVVLHTFEQSLLIKLLLLHGIVVAFAANAQRFLHFTRQVWAVPSSHQDTEPR